MWSSAPSLALLVFLWPTATTAHVHEEYASVEAFRARHRLSNELKGLQQFGSSAVHSARASTQPFLQSTGPLTSSLSSTVSLADGLKRRSIASRDETTTSRTCAQSTYAFTGDAYCFSAMGANGTQQACRTLWNSTTGCNVDVIPSTIPITASAVTAECDQMSCGLCASTNLPLSTTEPDCEDCTTRSGTIYAPQATSFPSGAPATTPVFITTASPGKRSRSAASRSKQEPGNAWADGETDSVWLSNSASKKSSLGDRSAVLSSDPAVDRLESGVAKDEESFQPLTNASLQKRTMLLPDEFGGIDEYMLAGVEEARRSSNLVEHRARRTGGRSSALFRPFRDTAFKLAVEGLKGCTCVILVSRKGAWMSHHWESPTFTDNTNPGTNSIEADILTGMFQGDNSGLYPGLNGLTNIFNRQRFGSVDNTIQAIIVTPVVHDFDFWSFDTSIFPEIINTWKWAPDVYKIWKAIRDTYGIMPAVVTYEPATGTDADVEEAWRTTAKGKVLLEYDPKQWVIPDQDHSCQVQWAAVRIHTEDGPVYDDQWHAGPDQGVFRNPGGHQRRDGKLTAIDWSQQVCMVTSSTTSSTTNDVFTTLPAASITSCSLATATSPVCICQGAHTKSQKIHPSSITGVDGKATTYCPTGVKGGIPVATSSTKVEACRLHINETLPKMEEMAIQLNFTVFDNTGEQQWSQTDVSGGLLQNYRLNTTVAGFKYDILVYPGVGGTNRDNQYDDIVQVTAGKLSWISSTMDDSKLPYCSVGNWEMHTDGYVGDGYGLRQMDCYWAC